MIEVDFSCISLEAYLCDVERRYYSEVQSTPGTEAKEGYPIEARRFPDFLVSGRQRRLQVYQERELLALRVSEY
jgi:hypothetical protein